MYQNHLDKQDNLIKKNDYQFKKALDRYKYHVRFKEKTYEFYQEEVARFLKEYDIILRNLLEDRYSCKSCNLKKR